MPSFESRDGGAGTSCQDPMFALYGYGNTRLATEASAQGRPAQSREGVEVQDGVDVLHAARVMLRSAQG